MNKPFVTILVTYFCCIMAHPSLAQLKYDTIPYSQRFLLKSSNAIIETIGEKNHTLLVNEIMASNAKTLQDENGDYDDWFEVYNYGEDSINLKNYYFSDSRNTPLKWKITDGDLYIQPKQHILFWADGETDQGNLHTNFKLSENGETVFIHNSEGTLIDELKYDNQTTDISFGRYPDGSMELFHFSEPSPGVANNDKTIEGILSEPTANIESGIYSTPVELILSVEEDDCEIYFTLNHEEPTANSFLYKEPILINKTSVIRAKAIKENYAASTTLTKTYIFDNQNYENPIINIVSDSSYLYGSQGILSGTKDIEIPAHMEYIVHGKTEYSSDMGIKLHSPKANKQYSMRFYARNRYGNSWFKYPFFENNEVEKFKRLIIRNSGNDCAHLQTYSVHFRDQLTHRLATLSKDAIVSDSKPVNVFINGEFFAVYNLRERIDEYFIETHFPDFSNYDLLERCFGFEGNRNAIYGDWDKWNEIINTIDGKVDLTDDDVFTEATKDIDIENFTDYWLTEVFVGNYDWLSNNVKFIVPDTGKSKWIYWDLDHSVAFQYKTYGEPGWNTLEWSLTFSDRAWPEGQNNRLVRSLIKNENYKKYFINRLSYLLNVVYSKDNIYPILDSMQLLYNNDMQKHAAKWSHNPQKWNENITEIKDYIEARPNHVFTHITDFFNMNNPIDLSIKTEPEGIDAGTIVFENNSEHLREFNGKVFPEYNYNIKAVARFPWIFVGWDGVDSNTPELNQKFNSNTSLTAKFVLNPNAQKIFMNEVYFNSSEKFSCSDWIEFVNLSDKEVDLFGYKLYQGNKLLFEFKDHVSIKSLEYIVLTEDKSSFELVYFESEFVYGELTNDISPQAEIILQNASNDTIQILNYEMGENNWPQLEANSFSYELVKYSDNVNSPSYWTQSDNRYGTPGKVNGNIFNFNNPNGTSKTIQLSNKPKHTINDTLFGYTDIDGHNFAGVKIIEINGPAGLQWENTKCKPDSIYDPGSFNCLAPNQNNTTTVIKFSLIDISGDHSPVYSLTILGPDDILSYNPEVTIFPNPTQDVLNINVNGFEESTMDILIYSLDGNIIKSLPNVRADNIHPLSLKNTKAGKYILSVSYNNRNTVKKFIKY